MKLNRRNTLIGTGATIALLSAGTLPARAQQVDINDLHKEPELGEKFEGPADASVVIVEYASATCPHCANFHNSTYKDLKKEFIDTGKVKFIFREFPFDDLALAAFMLARCAPEDKFFPMIDILFEQQSNWTRNNPRGELFKIAQLAGFTEESFNACLTNEEIARGIIAIRDKASRDFGVNATPYFFINGKTVPGNQDIEFFRREIGAALS